MCSVFSTAQLSVISSTCSVSINHLSDTFACCSCFASESFIQATFLLTKVSIYSYSETAERPKSSGITFSLMFFRQSKKQTKKKRLIDKLISFLPYNIVFTNQKNKNGYIIHSETLLCYFTNLNVLKEKKQYSWHLGRGDKHARYGQTREQQFSEVMHRQHQEIGHRCMRYAQAQIKLVNVYIFICSDRINGNYLLKKKMTRKTKIFGSCWLT